MNPDELGTWDGDVFRFHEPIDTGDRIIEAITFTDYEEADGITREDVISALINPIKMVWIDPESEELR